MHKHTVVNTIVDPESASINTVQKCTCKYMIKQKAMPAYTTGAARHELRGLLVAKTGMPQQGYMSHWPCQLGPR